MKSTRPKFMTRMIFLIGPTQKAIAESAVHNAPEDADRPLCVTIKEVTKARTLDQNAALWAGPMRDVSEQAWVEGRQYGAETWHEYFKRKYLPEDDDPELETLAKEGYRKWDIDPDGDRVLVGSTTQLTVRGMAQYITQIEAYGAGLGVQFHVRPQ